MSLVDENAEWKTRRVSFLGAAKSFVTQLSIGQDLTKVSLPSVFLYPFSALELGGSRTLQYFNILQEAKNEPDPTKRMLAVLSYYISQTRKEAFERKPSNSILAENHYCWIDTKNGRVNYLAEQVSHHPPISTLITESKNEGIRVLLTLESQGVKFHGNSLGISLRGPLKIILGEEEYNFSKAYPNIWIRNVIIGTKRESWDGEVTFSCEQTNLKGKFTYKEEGWHCTNVFNGVVETSDDQLLYKFTGAVAQNMSVTKISDRDNYSEREKEKEKERDRDSDRDKDSDSEDSKEESEEKPKKKGKKKEKSKGEQGQEQYVLVDYPSLQPNKIKYLPESEWDDKSSLKIWKQFFQYVLEDNMSKADATKKVIEEEQRERRKNGTDFVPQFFKFDESNQKWEFIERDLDSTFHKNSTS